MAKIRDQQLIVSVANVRLSCLQKFKVFFTLSGSFTRSNKLVESGVFV